MDSNVINIKLEDNYQFKAGDRVCYRSHPDICIGYVSSGINFGTISVWRDGKDVKLIPINVSDAWAIHFGHGCCPNSMNADEDEIMLYTGEQCQNIELRI